MVTPLYAALFALLYVFLSVRVVYLRRKHKVSLGTGEVTPLERAIRVHSNCLEYGVVALFLMAMAEWLSALPGIALHGFGCALLLGRLIHAYGVSQQPEDFRLRTSGMIISLTVIGVLALVILYDYLLA